jgi:hypothetical protein
MEIGDPSAYRRVVCAEEVIGIFTGDGRVRAEENTVRVAVVSKQKCAAVSCRTYEAAGTMVSVMGQ